MSSLTVRLDKDSHRTLGDLARNTGKTMQDVLAEAIEQYRRAQFLESANRAYAALRKRPKDWEHELQERRAWDRSLMDGQKESR
jgi:predicted transcriptional regulator